MHDVHLILIVLTIHTVWRMCFDIRQSVISNRARAKNDEMRDLAQRAMQTGLGQFEQIGVQMARSAGTLEPLHAIQPEPVERSDG